MLRQDDYKVVEFARIQIRWPTVFWRIQLRKLALQSSGMFRW
jgi:hypothetical protein